MARIIADYLKKSRERAICLTLTIFRLYGKVIRYFR
jgi:hypothetical protein